MSQIRPLKNVPPTKFDANDKYILYAEDIAQMKSLLYAYGIELEALDNDKTMFKIKKIYPLPEIVAGVIGAGQTYSDVGRAVLQKFVLPFGIDLNSFVFVANTYSSSPNFTFAIYSDDGQTKLFSVTATLSVVNGTQLITLPTTITLAPGTYYFVMCSADLVLVQNVDYVSINPAVTAFQDNGYDLTSGYLSITPTVLPDTFLESDISYNAGALPVLLFQN